MERETTTPSLDFHEFSYNAISSEHGSPSAISTTTPLSMPNRNPTIQVCPDDFYKLACSNGSERLIAGESSSHDNLERSGARFCRNAGGDGKRKAEDTEATVSTGGRRCDIGAAVSVQLKDVLDMLPKGEVLVWDTETCGIKKPAICQLGYVLIRNGRVEREREVLLQIPNGVMMETGAQNTHGISAQDCMWKGENPIDELSVLYDLMSQTFGRGGVCVGHNVAFDVRAFNFTMECFRNEKRLDKEPFFDTMRKSRDFSPLLAKNGIRKNFRLNELYTHLCNCEPCWARLHSALDDTYITAICYAKGRERMWWR